MSDIDELQLYVRTTRSAAEWCHSTAFKNADAVEDSRILFEHFYVVVSELEDGCSTALMVGTEFDVRPTLCANIFLCEPMAEAIVDCMTFIEALLLESIEELVLVVDVEVGVVVRRVGQLLYNLDSDAGDYLPSSFCEFLAKSGAQGILMKRID